MRSELKMIRELRQGVEWLNQALAETEERIKRIEPFALPTPEEPDPPQSPGPRPDNRGGVA